MARIFISMSGEGRGHATRVRSLVERMRGEHQFWLYAPGEAHEFLAKDYSTSADVQLIEIPGLKFHYVNHRIHLLKTIGEGFRFQFSQLKPLVRFLSAQIKQHQPDIILTDFEPALPRAARAVGKPFLSLTHQHFLLAYDFSWLPWTMRFFTWMTGLAVPLHYTGQKLTMISSFYPFPLKDRWKKRGAISLGPMIRPEIRQGAIAAGILPSEKQSDGTALKFAAEDSPFLLSYLRKHTPERVIEELACSGYRIKIYGVGVREPVRKLTFHQIDPNNFVADLLRCDAVVCAAGNQLLGECMYLGKPVLAIPETWHQEQLLNAHFLHKIGCGDFVTLEQFAAPHLQKFYEHQETYRTNSHQQCQGNDGTEQVIEILLREADQKPNA